MSATGVTVDSTTLEADHSQGAGVKKKAKSLKSCDVCGRGFIKLAHLIRHARTHGNERPFSCSKCDKAFARTDALQRHYRAVHAEESSRDEMTSPQAALTKAGAPDRELEEVPSQQANPNKKRKRHYRGDSVTAESETSSGSKSFAGETNLFHPDFRALFGLDQPTDTAPNGIQTNVVSAGQGITHVNEPSDHGSVYNNVVSTETLGVPDFVTPHATLLNSSTTAATSIPIASFMASFPQALPHVTTSLDATIDSWLTQEGGSHAAENALEMVFSKDLNIASQLGNTGQSRWNHAGSEQLAGHLGAGSSSSAHSSGAFSTSLPIGYSTPSGINGALDTGISKLYPFGLQFEDIWKSTPPSNHYAFDTIQHNDNNARGTALGPSSDSLHQHNQGAEALSKSEQGAHARQSLYHGRASQSNGGHQDQGQTAFSSFPLSGVDTQESYNSESAPLSSVPKRRVIHRGLTTDTWLNSMKMPEEGVAAAPRPDITSPEQVIGELSVETTMNCGKQEQAAIPSMKFLDSCLHLYFRDFHPTFPILHKPTFSRHQTPPLLLLSMCSIGCIFMGTQAAREKGLWIYERLHHVIVFSRDSRMATEDARVAMTLSGLLGQCFSFLYGQPKHMFTAESFHGCLCTFARRAGLFKLIEQNSITYENVADLDGDALEVRWQEWARREMLRRVALGLTLHAADAATYSLLPRLVPVQLSTLDQSSDALFEASDASSWKWLLLCLSGGSPGNPLHTPPSAGFQVVPTADTLFPMSIMAQKIVNTLQLKEMCRSEMTFVSSFTDVVLFYHDMQDLATRLGIFEEQSQQALHGSKGKSASQQAQILKVMWHYCCLARLARLDQIEEVAGREGVPQPRTVEEVKRWVNTPEARLATLHCGHVLHHASDLKDLAFIVPRAIFQSTLLLLCFIAFNEAMTGPIEVFDVTEATDWGHFAGVLAECSKQNVTQSSTAGRQADNGFQYLVDGRPLLAERWIRHGSCRWRLDKYLDGREKQMDYVSLLSTTTRLLRCCTPWGIGDAMGDILATINIGY